MRKKTQEIYVLHSLSQMSGYKGLEEHLKDKPIVLTSNNGIKTDLPNLVSNDFIVFLISTTFLNSYECMLGVAEIMKDEKWAKMLENDVLFYPCAGYNRSELESAKEKWERLRSDAQTAKERGYNTWHGSTPNTRYEQANAICQVIHGFVRAALEKLPRHNDMDIAVIANDLEKKAEESAREFKDHGSKIPGKNKLYEICGYIDSLLRDEKNIDDCNHFEKKLKALDSQNPVCVINTGGSASDISRSDKSGSSGSATRYIVREATLSELIGKLPSISDMDYDIHFYSFKESINSANVTSQHWISMAEVVDKLRKIREDYLGFVIIHGTYTMAYSAAALSFMFTNLDRPIVFTGSELPLGNPYTDAITNIERSISIAAKSKDNDNKDRNKGNEVTIFYGHDLLRGNRTTKHGVYNTIKGFESPNFGALGISRGRLHYSREYPDDIIRDPGGAFCEPIMSGEDNILLLDLYPDMNVEIFNLHLKAHTLSPHNDGFKALILRTFGVGVIPVVEEKYENLRVYLKEFIEEDNIVVSIAQEEISADSYEIFVFEEYKYLFDIGAVIGDDMILEAAYCKLKYLMLKHEEKRGDKKAYKKAIENDLRVNLRGELTKSSYVAAVEGAQHRVDSNLLEVVAVIEQPEFGEKFGINKMGDNNEGNISRIDSLAIRIKDIKNFEKLEGAGDEFWLKISTSKDGKDGYYSEDFLLTVEDLDETTDENTVKDQDRDATDEPQRGIAVDMKLFKHKNMIEIAESDPHSSEVKIKIYLSSETHSFIFGEMKIIVYVNASREPKYAWPSQDKHA